VGQAQGPAVGPEQGRANPEQGHAKGPPCRSAQKVQAKQDALPTPRVCTTESAGSSSRAGLVAGVDGEREPKKGSPSCPAMAVEDPYLSVSDERNEISACASSSLCFYQLDPPLLRLQLVPPEPAPLRLQLVPIPADVRYSTVELQTVEFAELSPNQPGMLQSETETALAPVEGPEEEGGPRPLSRRVRRVFGSPTKPPSKAQKRKAAPPKNPPPPHLLRAAQARDETVTP